MRRIPTLAFFTLFTSVNNLTFFSIALLLVRIHAASLSSKDICTKAEPYCLPTFNYTAPDPIEPYVPRTLTFIQYFCANFQRQRLPAFPRSARVCHLSAGDWYSAKVATVLQEIVCTSTNLNPSSWTPQAQGILNIEKRAHTHTHTRATLTLRVSGFTLRTSVLFAPLRSSRSNKSCRVVLSFSCQNTEGHRERERERVCVCVYEKFTSSSSNVQKCERLLRMPTITIILRLVLSRPSWVPLFLSPIVTTSQ